MSRSVGACWKALKVCSLPKKAWSHGVSAPGWTSSRSKKESGDRSQKSGAGRPLTSALRLQTHRLARANGFNRGIKNLIHSHIQFCRYRAFNWFVIPQAIEEVVDSIHFLGRQRRGGNRRPAGILNACTLLGGLKEQAIAHHQEAALRTVELRLALAVRPIPGGQQDGGGVRILQQDFRVVLDFIVLGG